MHPQAQLRTIRWLPALVVVWLSCLTGCNPSGPVPEESGQMLLVIGDSLTASTGSLQRFQRSSGGKWLPLGKEQAVILGRNGMGWGRGLHRLSTSEMPRKAEGDGRSPAGVFELGAVFGRTPPDRLPDLRMPYVRNNRLLECVDDPTSFCYNQLVGTDTVNRRDWTSAERMGYVGAWYDQGVVIRHNWQPVVPGAGSCIFLHNLVDPKETTAGCTELEAAELSRLITWLDSSRSPVLVQLPREWYLSRKASWKLP